MNTLVSKKVRFVSYDRFPRYLVGENGVIIDMLTRRVVNHTNSCGYKLITLYDKDGVKRGFLHHRLLAICFLDSPGPIEDLVVNHIDGVKWNNDLSNLEWCTVKENVYHAGRIGISLKCVPIEARNIDTGEILLFESMIECARYMGIHKDSMQYRLRNGPKPCYPERYQYRRQTDNTEWGDFNSACIYAREVKTNEVKFFIHLAALSDHYGFSPASATTWIRLEGQPVLPGYIQIKRETDPTPWREIDVPELELAKFNSTIPVRVCDQLTGRVSLFSSAAECADSLGILRSTLNERLNANGTRAFKGRTYTRVPVV